MQYVALLRGINVGGNNIIKMVDLKSHFEKMGFKDVQTYIQSGNVIFSTKEKSVRKLEEKLERELSKQFKYTSTVVVVSGKDLEETVSKAPRGFGKEPEKYRYDVIFLKQPFTPEKVIKEIRTKDGVDTAKAGEHVLYFTRLITKASSSYLSKIVGTPMYKQVTIRNWNTTTKLLSHIENK